MTKAAPTTPSTTAAATPPEITAAGTGCAAALDAEHHLRDQGTARAADR